MLFPISTSSLFSNWVLLAFYVAFYLFVNRKTAVLLADGSTNSPNDADTNALEYKANYTYFAGHLKFFLVESTVSEASMILPHKSRLLKPLTKYILLGFI